MATHFNKQEAISLKLRKLNEHKTNEHDDVFDIEELGYLILLLLSLTLFLYGKRFPGNITIKILKITATNFRIKSFTATIQSSSENDSTLPLGRNIVL